YYREDQAHVLKFVGICVKCAVPLSWAAFREARGRKGNGDDFAHSHAVSLEDPAKTGPAETGAVVQRGERRIRTGASGGKDLYKRDPRRESRHRPGGRLHSWAGAVQRSKTMPIAREVEGSSIAV